MRRIYLITALACLLAACNGGNARKAQSAAADTAAQAECAGADSLPLALSFEFEHYPLAATEAKIILTGYSGKDLNKGNGYELLKDNAGGWETLFSATDSDGCAAPWRRTAEGYEQTLDIRLAGKHGPGRYRCRMVLEGDMVLEAEFALADRKGVAELRRKIHDYWKTHSGDEDALMQNMYGLWDRDDTIHVEVLANTPAFREEFRRQIISYSAVDFGPEAKPKPFTQAAPSDTLGVTMRTEERIYRPGVKRVGVVLTNRSGRTLFFGEDYGAARREEGRWIVLPVGGIWNSVGILVAPGDSYRFDARLKPLVNDIAPGRYMVYKRIGFEGGGPEWFLSAEFGVQENTP